eukprot:scaffold1651_cov317-Pinguiococcus_pyrenoidosus.AAC.24
MERSEWRSFIASSVAPFQISGAHAKSAERAWILANARFLCFPAWLLASAWLARIPGWLRRRSLVAACARASRQPDDPAAAEAESSSSCIARPAGSCPLVSSLFRRFKPGKTYPASGAPTQVLRSDPKAAPLFRAWNGLRSGNQVSSS